MWEYTDKVKDHFLHPRNVGEIEDADGTGEVGSLACGDALRFTFKLDADGRITDAKFKTFGCGSAIASASALTEMVMGKTLEEAAQITNQDIADFLGGLPREKMHCSVMGREALEAAIADYKGEAPPSVEGEIVCECFGVTDNEIVRAVRENNLKTVEDVTHFTKAGGGCEKCHGKIQEILDQILAECATEAPAAVATPVKPVKLSNIQKIKLIEETLEQEVRPSLRKDGGDIELVDVEGNLVLVRLQGVCSSCSAAQVTLKDYVEAKLRELVTPDLVVEEVAA
ncbi:MAG: Fe-S cluster assembly protein NifU [Gaiellales bacterium]|nr:Fe-S cluster assembly protein NifU [Gaiellales bacterium]